MEYLNTFVIRDALFDQVKNLSFLHEEVYKEFYNNVINNHNNYTSLFTNVSNIYALVAMNGSNMLTRIDEEKWSNILSDSQYKFLQKYGALIIAYMDLDDTMSSDNYKFINFIDTRVPKKGLAYFMMRKYFNREDRILLPYEIIPSASKYWQAYFEKMCLYDDPNEVNELIVKYNIKWGEHYKSCILH
jgi:hypothetical protein